ncbi:elongation of very long chain fatty acids protein 7-like [Uloborus diversus]|uniref:elongation of very long chain fatty acids protein 7-like n=1 Tax=Uloborus diversus TaxID=327109 RepID=UPI0024095839|nr:elongation of very long chain fatty acids protein 7-like [Uloborus diversus]XP_054719825.1 elongation of very long chain fatty acids protein 7-like [Uloborus diversus]XP_054719826.1 elongation of very long chain fatty acids protein 7-like [Uloborus diversus]
MFAALEILNKSFKDFLDQGDPRVKDWPMMQTPFPGLAMIIAYIYFVKVAGPQFMKKRKPYDLRTIMAIYNAALVFINLLVFFGIGWYGYFNGYSLKCQPVDYSNRHSAVRMAQVGYYFYLTKFVEFADTIFFVLRKKDNQISALHVIHHSIVPFSLWFGVKFAPGGYNAFFPFLNSFVHVIMYTYYAVAALGGKYKKYLIWKKYMTYIQLSQFVCVIIYAISLYYHKCDVSTTFIAMNFVHALLFLGLFLNFFVKSYIHRTPTKRPSFKLVSSEKADACSTEETTCVSNKIQKNGYVKQLVAQIAEETERHRMNLHRCAAETCCNISCRKSHQKTGSHLNDCLPELSYFPKQNGVSLQNKKDSKAL